MALPKDATIESVSKKLSRPVDYVCGVLDNMYRCRKQHGNASVRIGVSGSGQKPYYRVMYLSLGGVEEVFDTFFENHVSFSKEGRPITGGDDWSRSIMTFDEVALLRGQLSGSR